MVSFSERSNVYRVALVLAYLTFLLYGLAFGIPFWFGPDADIRGLWMKVVGDDFEIDESEAAGFGDGGLGDWFEGVRACWVAGTFLYVVGLMASIVENCCSNDSRKDYGVTGVLILLAGLCGAAGVIVTAIKIHDDNVYDVFRWGFYIACIASGLAIIFSTVLLISRNAHYVDQAKSSRTADYVYAHKHPGPYTPEYTNPGYRNDELPLVNGLSQSMYRGSNGYGNGYPPHPGHRMEPLPTYNPYGYKENRPSNRSSIADSADLSNGFTSEMIQAEHSLGRRRDDYGRPAPMQAPVHAPASGSYGNQRNDFYYGREY